MYTYYIVNAGETAPESRIAKAIKNFGYQEEDVICIARGGYTSEIETVYSIRVMLNDFTTTDIDTLTQNFINMKNTDEE